MNGLVNCKRQWISSFHVKMPTDEKRFVRTTDSPRKERDLHEKISTGSVCIYKAWMNLILPIEPKKKHSLWISLNETKPQISNQSTAEPPSKRAKVHVTSRKRKRIRSLAPTGRNSSAKSNKNLSVLGIFTMISVGFIVFLWKNEQFRDELKHVAMNQFQVC